MNIISKVTINGKTRVNGRYVNLTGQNITITDRGMFVNGRVGTVVSKNGNVNCQTVEGNVESKNGNVIVTTCHGDCDTKNGNIIRNNYNYSK